MKSPLDLIIEQLENMSDDEIVKATSYKSESECCGIPLDDYEFYYNDFLDYNNNNTQSSKDFKELVIPNLNYNFDKNTSIIYQNELNEEYIIKKQKIA